MSSLELLRAMGNVIDKWNDGFQDWYEVDTGQPSLQRFDLPAKDYSEEQVAEQWFKTSEGRQAVIKLLDKHCWHGIDFNASIGCEEYYCDIKSSGQGHVVKLINTTIDEARTIKAMWLVEQMKKEKANGF